MSLRKSHIRDQIELINNGNKKEQIESLYIEGKFPFIYKGITNSNPDLGHNIKKLQHDQFVIVKFSIYSINF